LLWHSILKYLCRIFLLYDEFINCNGTEPLNCSEQTTFCNAYFYISMRWCKWTNDRNIKRVVRDFIKHRYEKIFNITSWKSLFLNNNFFVILTVTYTLYLISALWNSGADKALCTRMIFFTFRFAGTTSRRITRFKPVINPQIDTCKW